MYIPSIRARKDSSLLPTRRNVSVILALLSPLAVQATTRTVTTVVDSADTTLYATGSVTWYNSTSSRVGEGSTNGVPSDHVFPVVLPALATGESITGATLSFNIEGWNNWGDDLTNLDLYGIYLTNTSPTINTLDYYVDGVNPSSNTYAALLDDDIATPADIGSGAGSAQNLVKTSVDLSAFFQDLYNGGAQAGDFAFLTLAHDSTLGIQRHYNISTANSTSYAKPQVEFTITSGTYLYVDGAAAGGGDGSSGAPYNNIQDAIDAAVGGETIVVADGIYNYGIQIEGEFDASAPLTIEAAPGAHPTLDGGVVITGWSGPDSNGVYWTDTTQAITNFYVGDRRQPTARWPDLGQSWVNITNVDYANDELTIDTALPSITGGLQELTGYAFLSGANAYMTNYVTSLSTSPDRVGFDPTDFYNSIEKNGNIPTRMIFMNHKDLISVAGEWARENLGGGTYRIYFKPASTADLLDTRTTLLSTGINIAGYQKVPSNVTVRGFTVRNFASSGIEINHAEYITIEDCVVYNVNSVAAWGSSFGSLGTGLIMRSCTPSTSTTDPIITVRRSVFACNYKGMNINTCQNVLVEECEIAKNANDGLFINGGAAHKNDSLNGVPFTWTDGVLLSKTYVHHHLYEKHPDNMQFVLGTRNLVLDGVLGQYSGQGIMSYDVESNFIHHSAFIGSGADNIKLGIGGVNEIGWTLTDSTVLFARYRAVEMSAPNTHYEGNIIYGSFVIDGIASDPTAFTADYNLYWPGGSSESKFFQWTNPGFQAFTTDLAAYQTATGQGANSKRVDPLLANVPLFQGRVEGNGDSTESVLRIAGAGMSSGSLKHQVGDYLEINGDGILRQITNVVRDGSEEMVTINPALPEAPFRMSISLNWGPNPTSTVIDIQPVSGSPALGAGPGGIDLGSPINVGAYQLGDFDADGNRDLPTLPSELAWQLGNPNNYTHPYTVIP